MQACACVVATPIIVPQDHYTWTPILHESLVMVSLVLWGHGECQHQDYLNTMINSCTYSQPHSGALEHPGIPVVLDYMFGLKELHPSQSLTCNNLRMQLQQLRIEIFAYALTMVCGFLHLPPSHLNCPIPWQIKIYPECHCTCTLSSPSASDCLCSPSAPTLTYAHTTMHNHAMPTARLIPDQHWTSMGPVSMSRGTGCIPFVYLSDSLPLAIIGNCLSLFNPFLHITCPLYI